MFRGGCGRHQKSFGAVLLGRWFGSPGKGVTSLDGVFTDDIALLQGRAWSATISAPGREEVLPLVFRTDSHQHGLKIKLPYWLITIRAPCCDVVDQQPQRRVSFGTPDFPI